jgi:hypothetical protein
MTTLSRPGHARPSVQLHIQPEESFLDAALFNAIVRPEQNAHASLRKNRMRRLKIDMITRDVSTRGSEPIRGQELFDREVRELHNP